MEQDISNENRNDFYWKNKLEDVSSLPDAVLTDKDSTWGKLHNRLHTRRRDVKKTWYWMAAACLMLAIIIPVTMYNKEHAIAVKNITEKSKQKKETIPALQSSKENAVVHVSVSRDEKKLIRRSLKVDKKSFAAMNDVIKEDPAQPVSKVQADIVNAPVISPSAADSNGLHTLALAPVKKKLKVVHINELREPLIETPNMAVQYEQKFFQVKLINHLANTGTSLPSGNAGFTIFKTTKTSAN